MLQSQKKDKELLLSVISLTTKQLISPLAIVNKTQLLSASIEKTCDISPHLPMDKWSSTELKPSSVITFKTTILVLGELTCSLLLNLQVYKCSERGNRESYKCQFLPELQTVPMHTLPETQNCHFLAELPHRVEQTTGSILFQRYHSSCKWN